jgi:hypothetical protein
MVPSTSEHLVAERWAWILDVLFGAILAVAFEALSKNLDQVWDETPREAARVMFVALCFMSFFLYDVFVYHFVITLYPYRISFLSACRYVLDILMAFLLMEVLVPGVRPGPKPEVVKILVSLTLWHLCAAAWHCLANWDHFKKAPPPFSLFPHLGFIVLYWSTVLGWMLIRGAAGWPTRLEEVSTLVALGVPVLAVALYRSRQLIQRLGRTTPLPFKVEHRAVMTG